MKLRNKKTGEIIDLNKGSITDVGLGTTIQLQATDRYNKPIWCYHSLAELNDEWEDYEESKNYFYLTAKGNIHNIEDLDDEGDEQRKAIGNYFETREEAEKAVEKLKAFKRLQDLGFRFEGVRFRNNHNYIEWKVEHKNELTNDETREFLENLHKVFGGKDESNQ